MDDTFVDPSPRWEERLRKRVRLTAAHVERGREGYCLFRDMNGASILLLPTARDPEPKPAYYGNTAWKFVDARFASWKQ